MGQVVALANSHRGPSRAHLTKDVLERMPSGGKIYDDEVAGLHVIRGKHGWSFRAQADLPTTVVRQRLKGSATVVLTLGRFPQTSIKKARSEARRVIGEIKSGRDPRKMRHDPAAFTLREAYDWYLGDWAIKAKLRENTLRNYRRSFAVLARWHAKPLALIASSPLELAEEHARLTRTHGPSVANAALAFLGYVHRHARHTRPDLPLWPERAVTMHQRGKSKAAQGMGPNEVGKWWREVQERVSDHVRRGLLKFELLSGLRSGDAV